MAEYNPADTENKEPNSPSENPSPAFSTEGYKLSSPPPNKSLLQKLKSRPRIVIPVLSFLILFIASLLFVYFTKTNLTNASIAGVQAGKQIDTKKLEKPLQSVVDKYQVALSFPGGKTKSFPLKDTGIQSDIKASIDNAKTKRRNTPLLERLAFWKTTQTPLSLKVNESALSSFLSKEATVVSKPAKNAELSINKGEVIISPEASGQGTTINNAKETLLYGIGTLQTAPFKLETGELKPALTKNDLESSKKKAENILAQNVTLKIGNETIKAKPSDIGNWIEFHPVDTANTVDVTVNGGKVQEYIDSIAKHSINPARAQIVSTQPDGSSSILVQGQNGSDIKNKKAVAAEITKKVSALKDVEVDLPIIHSPFKTVTAQAYDKWLAVDVTTKRMYAYEKTNLAKTFLISAGAPGTPTVLGHYNIKTKVAKQDMRGNNADGSRYFQADVRWVNYFHQDYAIHGNHWRATSYFGNINSSHGCVGIQNPDAEWVFKWAPVGTPVVIYD